MPFSIRLFRHLPVQYDVTYHVGSSIDTTMTDTGNDRV